MRTAMRPAGRALFASMAATWPPIATRRLGPALLRQGKDGGNRVSAATMEDAWTPADIDAAEAAMRDMGQSPLWQLLPGQDDLDAMLDARGYAVHEPVWLYLGAVASMAEAPPRVSAFAHWPPLAIQRDLWAEGGIGPGRIAIMERVEGPKAALLARNDDHPSGVGFVAIADGIAWVHALHTAEAARRNGAGRNMMRQAAVWARQNGADWLGLAVTRANVAGNGLYASLGMEIVEQYHYRILREG